MCKNNFDEKYENYICISSSVFKGVMYQTFAYLLEACVVKLKQLDNSIENSLYTIFNPCFNVRN